MKTLFTCLTFIWIVCVAFVSAQNDPTSFSCTVLSSSSIQLSWTRPANTLVNGYHLSGERIDGIINGTTLPDIDLSSYTYAGYTFNGLGNFAQYRFTVHSYIGGTNYTDVTSTCTTSEDAPNGAPFDFNCTAVSETSITCEWSALERAYWNGVLTGYRIEWLGPTVSEIYSANVSDTTYTYTVTSLAIDTRYILLLCPFTSVNYGSVYSTAVETTLGAVTKTVENATRYYCYEAVPGMIEFSWEEMPCTIYTGSIGGLLMFSMLLLGIMCCQSCCQKNGSPGIEINMVGGSSRGASRHSRASNGSHDDDGSSSTTDTDTDDILEENLSDNESQGDSVKSPLGDLVPSVTPAGSEIGASTDEQPSGSVTRNSNMEYIDGQLSDSDYSSDMDEPGDTNKKGKGKAKAVTQEMKMKTLSKPHKPIIHSENGTVTKELEAETPDVYEDWDPDSTTNTNKNNTMNGTIENDNPHSGGPQKWNNSTSVADSQDNSNMKQMMKAHSSTHPVSDWDDDGVIERSASVSSIMVDTPDNVFDSVWSHDITGTSKPTGQLVQNKVFASKAGKSIPAKKITAGTAIGESNKMPMTNNEPDLFNRNVSQSSPMKHHDPLVSFQLNPENPKEIPDSIDHINLEDNQITTHRNTPSLAGNTKRGSFIKNSKAKNTMTSTAPAWLSKRQRDDIRRASNVTPVQEVNITPGSVTIDIEPVLGSDRLGKKFPFLSLDNNENESMVMQTRVATNAWSRPRKQDSMARVKIPLTQTTIMETKISVPEHPVAEGGSYAESGSKDSNETKNQLTYGFGVGRFRQMAKGWVNKLRMKKGDVKVAHSKWD